MEGILLALDLRGLRRQNLKLGVTTIEDVSSYSPILPKSFPTCSDSPKTHVRILQGKELSFILLEDFCPEILLLSH